MTTLFRRLPLPLAGIVFALLVYPAAADDKPARAQPPAGKATVTDLLARRVNVDKFEGKFGDAVEMLRDNYGLPLTIDPSLEVRSDNEAPLKDQPVKLPKLTNVRADTVLRLTCDQVNGMFLTEPDHIRLVNSSYGLVESGVWKQSDPTLEGESDFPLPTADRVKYQPAIKRALVNAAFTAKPVAEILDAIAESTGANVILAPEAADKAKQPLTVRFANTPVDTAVRTVCEMAELGIVEDGDVLLVTTPERAAARVRADEQKRQARAAEIAATRGAQVGLGGLGGVGGLGGGLGGVAIGGGVMPGSTIPAEVTAELNRLKDQNEQLKKQLDEIQKQLKK